MGVRVRAFVEEDRDVLRALFVAANAAAFMGGPPEAQKAEDFDRLTEGERILVATIDGRVVGFASIWEPDSFLHNLFVHPEHQRRGVGRALLIGCEPLFSSTPTLKCLVANENAKQFYVAQGWRVIGEGHGTEGPYLLMAREPAPTFLSSGLAAQAPEIGR